MTQNGDTVVTQWDLIRAFLALERHGDYALAAEMEGIDDSTLRRRIRMLEQQMGRTLFVRADRAWRTASDQYELVQAALRMEAAARTFSRTRQGGSGIIRISVIDAFAQRLSNIFGQFHEKYPRLVLNITTENHFVDLEKDQVDIAIRLARPMQAASSLRIRKLGEVRVNAYVSRLFLDKIGVLGGTPEKHSLHQLAMNLRFSHGDHNFTYGALDFSQFGLHGEVITWTDSFLVLARMCELGFGVAIMPDMLAQDYPGLQPLNPERASAVTEMWMISRFDLRAAWQRDLANMLQVELTQWNV